jgi:hypothetical protein
MTSLVLLAGFSASVMSSLAMDRRHLPFTGLKGLLHDGSYKLGVVENSFVFSIFDVCSRYTSHYWLLQLYNLQRNGMRIAIFKFRMSALYVCMYVCTCVCVYVCMYMCIYVCMYIFMHVTMQVCMYMGTYVRYIADISQHIFLFFAKHNHHNPIDLYHTTAQIRT